jgi:hypothetical protein
MFVGTFEFEEGGRSYRCCVEGERSARTGAWWWFGVSGDPQRYAPFHSEPGDTKDSVRTRIVAYYNDLLVRRATPTPPRHSQGRRPGQLAATGAAVVPAATEATGVPDEPAHEESTGTAEAGSV